MEQLKKQCMKNFILTAFVLAVLESIVDSVFDDILVPCVPKGSIQFRLVMWGYLFVSMLLFVVAAYVYWRTLNRTMKEEMKRQMEEKNLLIANITHDLKTPITSILGFSRMILDAKAEPEEMGQIAEIIYDKSKKTNTLINEMFSYVKLDTTSYELPLEKKDICTLMRNLTADLYEEYEKRNMTVDVRIPEQSFFVMADEMELTRAVTNLLVNAYQHNQNGSRIQIRITKEEEKIVVYVMDNGSQISEEIRSTLFEPFICGDESRNEKGGSGLGLAIAKKIIEKHGGSLTLENAADGYTKMFVITLTSID